VTRKDAATLSGGYSPTGSMSFTLYEPDQASCSGTSRFTQTVSVAGNGTYGSTGGFVTDKPGTWRWRASYSGDASNDPASTGCNDEQVDRKSTRLNSSHVAISYAVYCLKKKKKQQQRQSRIDRTRRGNSKRESVARSFASA